MREECKVKKQDPPFTPPQRQALSVNPRLSRRERRAAKYQHRCQTPGIGSGTLTVQQLRKQLK